MYLYLEGLKRFQDPDIARPEDPLSFFQIAGKRLLNVTFKADFQGIHGVPYETWPAEEWNHDIPGRTLTKDDFGGFCTHSSILFLTWHRPYLSLFEVCLISSRIQLLTLSRHLCRAMSKLLPMALTKITPRRKNS